MSACVCVSSVTPYIARDYSAVDEIFLAPSVCSGTSDTRGVPRARTRDEPGWFTRQMYPGLGGLQAVGVEPTARVELDLARSLLPDETRGFPLMPVYAPRVGALDLQSSQKLSLIHI